MITLKNFYKVSAKLSNSYIYIKGKKCLVFDVAFKGEKYITGFLKDNLNKEVSDITLIAITHRDIDHFGGVAAMSRQSKAKVALPEVPEENLNFMEKSEESYTRMATGFREMTKSRFWKMYTSGKRKKRKRSLPVIKGENSSRFSDLFSSRYDYLLKDKDTLPGFPEWQVFSTPGHSSDSVCYYHKKKGILITGDTLLASIRDKEFKLPSIYSNRKKLKESFELIKSLDAKIICPGHGPMLHAKLLNKKEYFVKK